MGPENGFFFLCFLSTILGSLGAWIIVQTGYQLGLIDHPNQRSSHRRPTPKGGGIGILAAFVVASFFTQCPSTFWIPAALLALLSFFGDKLDLSPRLRLPLQFVAAVALLAGTGHFQIGQIIGSSAESVGESRATWDSAIYLSLNKQGRIPERI